MDRSVNIHSVRYVRICYGAVSSPESGGQSFELVFARHEDLRYASDSNGSISVLAYTDVSWSSRRTDHALALLCNPVPGRLGHHRRRVADGIGRPSRTPASASAPPGTSQR